MSRRRLLIYGAGGHGREVADVVRHMAVSGDVVAPAGFVDDDASLHGKTVAGLPVLGSVDQVDSAEFETIVAVGAPGLMKELVARARNRGMRFANAIAPSAHVSPRADIGEGVMIFPTAVIQPDVTIGRHVILNVAASISHDTVVGDYANINPGARLAGNVRVGEGAFVGMGAHVIQGVTIGKWSIVGAGAAVIDDVPPYSTVVGVPARIVKQRDSEVREQ